MTNLTEQKQKANEYRKTGRFKEALQLYRNLWMQTGDKFDGAGLLHCLRKLELFEEAIVLADELIAKYPDFDWCRNEVIWTYIYGKLNKLEEGEYLEDIEQVAQKIMDLNPEILAAKMVVFKVLKSAKSSGDWKTVDKWVIKLDPEALSTEPMTDSSGREGWSNQSLWYNYRIKSLIETGSRNEAIALVDKVLERFPKQRKFFLRLKALAYFKLGNLTEAEKIYQDLCSGYKPDWWLLHEYAKIVRATGQKENALRLMFKAANSQSKLETMVSLFEDIGKLCKEIGKNEEALNHLVLCKNIRYEKHWSVSDSVLNSIIELNELIADYTEPSSTKEALRVCQNYWKNSLGDESNSRGKSYDKRTIRKGLTGILNLGKDNHPFCFIIAENNDSFFCFKSDLPHIVKDGDRVAFDAIPSFDKKKNKESWKASNIKYYA